MRSRLRLLRCAALAIPLAFAACRHAAPAPSASPAATQSSPAFAALVARLSEPGGFFDSDNLITNETSYLHVIGALKRQGVQGGAYVGVGPDQSFSYIAAIRPSVAFMLDIRRDNMLEHLLFKSLFAGARNRAEFLALLTGRRAPSSVEAWGARPIADLVAYIDSTRVTPESEAAARAVVRAGVRRTGVPLDSNDLATIARYHGAFIDNGLELRYESLSRPGRGGYFPGLRELLLARDLEGQQSSYLAREDAFQFMKDLEARDLVIPVTGNLAGPHALAAVGEYVRSRGERISALYTSNAEDYMMRDGSFPNFAKTVAALPRDAHSVIIRSYFNGFRGQHPQSVPGFRSTQLLQSMDAFAATVAKGGYMDYYQLVTDGTLPLVP
jgi:hypothetical protein